MLLSGNERTQHRFYTFRELQREKRKKTWHCIVFWWKTQRKCLCREDKKLICPRAQKKWYNKTLYFWQISEPDPLFADQVLNWRRRRISDTFDPVEIQASQHLLPPYLVCTQRTRWIISSAKKKKTPFPHVVLVSPEVPDLLFFLVIYSPIGRHEYFAIVTCGIHLHSSTLCMF